MSLVLDPRLEALIDRQPWPLVFVTVSGAHLYGFPSPDSDWDLRGVHVLPWESFLGLRDATDQTVEFAEDRDGLEADLVTHDARKFFRLLLRPNGYVLEQLLSPLVVRTSPEHERLVELAPRLFTCHHAHHYLGFARTQWRLFEKESPRRVKPLLYTYRVLLTGIHLMRTGILDANLVRLNDVYRLPQIPDLIARKLGGAEKGTLGDDGIEFHGREYERLLAQLEEARTRSVLPTEASCEPELEDLLRRLRTDGVSERA